MILDCFHVMLDRFYVMLDRFHVMLDSFSEAIDRFHVILDHFHMIFDRFHVMLDRFHVVHTKITVAWRVNGSSEHDNHAILYYALKIWRGAAISRRGAGFTRRCAGWCQEWCNPLGCPPPAGATPSAHALKTKFTGCIHRLPLKKENNDMVLTTIQIKQKFKLTY